LEGEKLCQVAAIRRYAIPTYEMDVAAGYFRHQIVMFFEEL